MGKTICRQIIVKGTVQGVGFRPFIYNLAHKLGLGGTVCNSGQGVDIEIEGPEKQVEEFIAGIQSNPPVLARISSCHVKKRPLQGYKTFTISLTRGNQTGESLVPPDMATCADCHREVMDPLDRHFLYPFTNCTNCGPRFTIVSGLPYDRERTSMASFTMCESCAREYADPSDRRFHAQPVACPRCGPQVFLVDRYGKKVEGDWLKSARQLFAEGKIIAVKSLGGFHLACNAEDSQAINLLRIKKGRPARPLAIMCRDLETARRYCRISPGEEALLCSPSAPVVILERLPHSPLPQELAPGLNTVGVMLPYTPLHILLMKEGPPVLVMTSGNRSGLPLEYDNGRALNQLREIADYFLLHDRDILNRCDDSVVCHIDGKTQFLRRSRGYVPRPLRVPTGNGFDMNSRKVIFLGTGGDMKNTFCLLKSGRAYISQHIGSVDTLEGQTAWRQSFKNLCRILRMEPRVIAYDLHPDYLSSQMARTLGCADSIGVQHHHGHMASCMADNGLDGDVIGLILDGTGYGLDGNIWGGEVLSGGYTGFSRQFHLSYMPLPGGDRSVKNPWMTAVSYLITALGDDGYTVAEKIFPGKLREIGIIDRMIRGKINSPLTSSCGRLFDAMSALLGVCLVNTYEGQAAVELGEMVHGHGGELLNPYPFQFKKGVIEIKPVLRAAVKDINCGISRTHVARRFHDTIAAIMVDAAIRVRAGCGLTRVVLSGGCWHNRYLLITVHRVLTEKGFDVFCHRDVPPGDGGICLGQAVIASHKWVRKRQ